jgi:hypothetical protein
VLFRRFRLNRVAKRYATLLPPMLARSYGASAGKRYTAAQVRTAVSKLKLDGRYIALAYAAFLAEDAFNSLRPEMPMPIAYQEALDLFRRHVPRRVSGEGSSGDYSVSCGGGSISAGGGPD